MTLGSEQSDNQLKIIDLETQRPTMFWMYSDGRNWLEEQLQEPKIPDNRMVFDYPNQHTTRDDYFVEINRQPDGFFDGGSKNFRYRGARADTETHIILTGIWASKNDRLRERGVFITVFPKKQEGVER
jgi:hypothetical protein